MVVRVKKAKVIAEVAADGEKTTTRLSIDIGEPPTVKQDTGTPSRPWDMLPPVDNSSVTDDEMRALVGADYSIASLPANTLPMIPRRLS